MTTATKDRTITTTTVTKRFPPFSVLAVVVASIGVVWPGGRVPVADRFFMLAVLGVILGAVMRYPGVKELVDVAPVAAKRGAVVVLGLFLVGQLWGVSTQTFPVVSWTMYQSAPPSEAVVYLFDAESVDGEPIAFTPSAANRLVPAKIALVIHLRQLSDRVYQSSMGSDADQLAADEAALRRAIVSFVELYNAKSPGAPPVSVEVTRVTYDVSQGQLTVDSGARETVMHIELETS